MRVGVTCTRASFKSVPNPRVWPSRLGGLYPSFFSRQGFWSPICNGRCLFFQTRSRHLRCTSVPYVEKNLAADFALLFVGHFCTRRWPSGLGGTRASLHL